MGGVEGIGNILQKLGLHAIKSLQTQIVCKVKNVSNSEIKFQEHEF